MAHLHKEQPSQADIASIGGLSKLNEDELRGLKIAAYICRLYADGAVWAEAIESHGEQQRALFWMKKDGCDGPHVCRPSP